MSDMLISRDLFTAKVNSTMMSMNERFTYLQKKARPNVMSLMTIRAKNMAQQQASAKNRRLALQMEKRLSAMAALKLVKKSIRQRLGIPNTTITARTASVRDRLTLPLRGRGVRGRKLIRNRGRILKRTQSIQSLQGAALQRTSSVQSLNKGQQRRARSRSRSRARTPAARSRMRSQSRQKVQTNQRSPSVGRAPQKGNFGRQRRFSTASAGSFGRGAQRPRRGRKNSMGLRGQRLGGNKFGGNQRGRNRQGSRGNFKGANLSIGRNQGMRGGKGGRNRRGKVGGRLGRGGGSGGGRGGQTKVIIPTKEELDKQLEQYMANTKSHLDREIDTYMKESGANDF